MSNDSKIPAEQERPFLYSSLEAIEHIQTLNQIIPKRLFKVLFPLWNVEVKGITEKPLPLGLIEKYLQRGIVSGLQTTQALASFFQLSPQLVEKVLAVQAAMGFITSIDGKWNVTPLGNKVIATGMKVTIKETRRRLYFDAFELQPLHKTYYNRRFVILSEEKAEKEAKDQKFQCLFPLRRWLPEVVTALGQRRDKDNYNLPDEVEKVTAMDDVVLVYLPMYIFETYSQARRNKPYYIVYTRIEDRRDVFFEELVNTCSSILSPFLTEKKLNEHRLWLEWLSDHNLTDAELTQTPNGMWQAKIPPETFLSDKQKKVSIASIGTYEQNRKYFLHIWCDDEELRAQAALELTLKRIKGQWHDLNLQTVQGRLEQSSARLQVEGLTISDLCDYANKSEMKEVASILEGLKAV